MCCIKTVYCKKNPEIENFNQKTNSAVPQNIIQNCKLCYRFKFLHSKQFGKIGEIQEKTSILKKISINRIHQLHQDLIRIV